MNEDVYTKAQIGLEQQKQDMSFLQNPPRKEGDSIFTKHLDAEELLEKIEKLLMGYEYDSEGGNYKPIYKTIMHNGSSYQMEQGPLLDPNYVRLSIGYLKTFLNSNVFLSYIENMDQINSIMWDVNIKLTRLLHPLKNIYDPKTVEMTYALIETSIYFAINRSYKKNTLDAFTKAQHSIEHLGAQQVSKAMTDNDKKTFKIFGF